MEFDPQWIDSECSLFKRPHDLQHMHLMLTKHGRFCKQNNQLLIKRHDELKDNSNRGINSTALSVGSWLFCRQDLPCSVSFWCILGGSVEVWTKNMMYRHQSRVNLILAFQVVLKWVWPLNEPHEIGCSSFKFKHYLQECTTSGTENLIMYTKEPTRNHRGSNSHWVAG